MSVRDKVILLFYLLVGLYAFIPSSLGPLMPFLRADLNLSYTTAAYHFSALAIGVIVAGSTGDRIIRRVGRQVSLWGGIAGMCAGIALLVSAHHVAATILSFFLIGSFGSLMGQTVDTVIAEQLGEQRKIAITEATVVTSICATMAPAAVSLFIRFGLNWRVPLVLLTLMFGVAWLSLRGIRIPQQLVHEKEEALSGTLPLAYWAYWLVILLGCASEWSIAYWSADFLQNVAKMAKNDALAAVSVFFGAMLLSRIVGSRLSAFISIHKLLPITAAFSLFGFCVFWLGQSPVINILGLFLAGLGTANMYPYTLSAALGVSPKQSALAASRMNVATGASGLFGPQVLGWLADHIGIFRAYGIVALLMTLAFITVLWANRKARQREMKEPAVAT